jgi:hypothetical protein
MPVRKESVKDRLERAYLYHYGKKESGIVLCGSFPRQGDSSKWYDYSPYANHGTITGATWERLPSGVCVNSFDGTDDTLSLPDLRSYFTDSATFITWIKLDVQTPPAAAQSGHWYLSTTGDGHYPFIDGNLYINTFRANRVDGIADANDRTVWHMVTITTTPGVNNWKMYHNLTLLKQTDAEATVAIAAPGGANGSWLGTGAQGLSYYLPASQIAGIFYNERHLFGV